MKKLVSLFLLFAALNGLAQSEKFPFNTGEELTYSAHYHWGLLWMEAGEVIFKVDTLHRNDEIILKMKSVGKTLPKYDWLFKVRDTFFSEAVYPEMHPIYFKRANYEAKDWVRNTYLFDRDKNFIIRDMETNLLVRKIDTIALPDDQIMDIQTAVYYARSWNLKEAKPGDQRVLKIILAGEFFSIPMTYQAKEIVEHINGKRYSCYKITTKVVEGLIFRANQEITIYVTDDENQLPLLVKAPILIGKVEAFLKQTKAVDFPECLTD